MSHLIRLDVVYCVFSLFVSSCRAVSKESVSSTFVENRSQRARWRAHSRSYYIHKLHKDLVYSLYEGRENLATGPHRADLHLLSVTQIVARLTKVRSTWQSVGTDVITHIKDTASHIRYRAFLWPKLAVRTALSARRQARQIMIIVAVRFDTRRWNR